MVSGVQQTRTELRSSTLATATPVSESITALAAIVLAILGLVSVVPNLMAAIITIVIGAGILMQGAQTVGEYSRVSPAGVPQAALSGGWAAGITLEFLAGGTGIVLGILALFSNTAALVPAALIVFGGTLLLNGAVMTGRGSNLPQAELTAADTVSAEMFAVAGGAQIMVGIAAMVLGILALIPIQNMVLTLVGLLAVGAALLVAAVPGTGAAFGAFRE